VQFLAIKVAPNITQLGCFPIDHKGCVLLNHNTNLLYSAEDGSFPDKLSLTLKKHSSTGPLS
jgi:hypothetical protein